jgi:hypothetical protein
MMLIRLIAPAATMAFIILSSMLIPRSQLALLWNSDAGFLTVPANQDLDHVRDASVFQVSGFAHGFLNTRIDSQVERCDFGSGHAHIVSHK